MGRTHASIGNLDVLGEIFQMPEQGIYRYEIFVLARTLAIRFGKGKEDTPFIPVYPELVRQGK